MSTDPASDGHPEDDDAVLRQLMNQARLIRQLRHDLDALAHEATDSVASLQTRIEDIEHQSLSIGSVRTSWCWRNIGPHGAQELWHQLTEWVTRVRSRYPLARRIPACCVNHPEIVEELTALYMAWQYAYEDLDAPRMAAADWHDRWLPGVLHRLEHGPFALDCEESHRSRPEAQYSRSLPAATSLRDHCHDKERDR